MAQYCIINGMAVSINNQFNGYSLMASSDQLYHQQQQHIQQQSNEYFHHPTTILQPLPAAAPPPPPPPQLLNGDAYCYTSPYNINGNSIPMAFQLKTEPSEEIIDDEDENLLQPMKISSTTTTLQQQQQQQLHQGQNEQQQQHSLNEDQFNLITADLKKKLSNSGFTQLPKDDPILKPFKCPICDKAFGRLSHVKRHQLLHTGVKPFECEVCHEKFTRIENRTRHMSIHTGERRHNCNVCGKGFSQLNRLNVHIRIHSGERPFVCEICGKAFGRMDHKNSHMRTHNWVRDKNVFDIKPTISNTKMELPPFVGNIDAVDENGDSVGNCSADIQIKQEPGTSIKIQSATSSQMTMQGDISMMTTTSSSNNDIKIEKPFKCQTCDKQFSRKDHLNRHVFIHSGTKPFQCEICSKLFSRKDNKYKHMASCMYMNFGIIIMKKPPNGSSVFNAEESKSLETKINEKLMEIQNGTLIPITRGQQIYGKQQNQNNKFDDNKTMLYEQIVQYQNETNQMSESFDTYNNDDDDVSAASQTDSGTMIESKDGAVEISINNSDVKKLTNSDDDYDDPEDDELEDNDDDYDDGDDADDNCTNIPAPECQLTEIDQGEINDNSNQLNYMDSQSYDNDFDNENVDGSMDQQMIENWRRQFECKVCNKWFVYKSHLLRHMLVHSGEKAFACDQCDKRFYRKEHLQRHVITHTGIKPYKCNFCDKSFIEQRAQIRHTLQHHEAKDIKQHKMFSIQNEQKPIVGFSSSPSYSLTSLASVNKWDMVKPVIEMKLSSDGQQMIPTAVFKCDLCDKAYRRKSHLKQHYTSHTGVKPFKCELCDQRFSRLEHKKRHQAIHMNIKRYECEFCDRKFSRPDHMLTHLKRHEGVLPYKCNRCGLRFGTSKEKIDHLRTHVDAYRCDGCSDRFETHRDLIEHRQTVHGSSNIKLENNVVKQEILVNKQQEFPCPICHQSYQLLLLADHLKTHVKNFDDTTKEIVDNEQEKIEKSIDTDDDYDDDYDEDDDDDVEMNNENRLSENCSTVKIEIESSDENYINDNADDYDVDNNKTVTAIDSELNIK